MSCIEIRCNCSQSNVHRHFREGEFPKTLDGMDEMDKMDFAKKTALQNAPHGAIRPQDDIE